MAAKKDPWQFTVRFNPQNSTHRQAADFLNQCGHFKAQCIAEAMDVYLRKKKMEAETNGPADGTLDSLKLDESMGIPGSGVEEPMDIPGGLEEPMDIPGGGLDDAALDDDDIAAILKSMGMFGDDD